MSDLTGSTGNPYVEFPFDQITEVHWKSGVVVLVEASAPITLYPDDSLGILPAFDEVSTGRYPLGSNIPAHVADPTQPPFIGYDDVTFLLPYLSDGTAITTILNQFTRPMQTPVVVGDYGFTYVSAKPAGETRWQYWAWDNIGGPPLPNTDILSYKFTDNLVDSNGNAFSQAHAAYDNTDPTTTPWSAEVKTTQIAARFVISTIPLLINMDQGQFKTGSIRVTQPPLFDQAPYPNSQPTDFPATRIRAYSGGTWLVGANDVSNVGGKLVWDHSVSPVAFVPTEIPLGTFNAGGFTPPTPP